MKVTLIDSMGTDLSVVNSARVSFGKKSEWENEGVLRLKVDGTFVSPKPVLSKADQSLISFLARGCASGDWDSLLIELKDKCVEAEESNIQFTQEIKDLVNHVRKMPDHWTPFGHTAITLHIKVPIFVARQLGKHQVGFVWNEVSRRYVTDSPEFYVPETWRKAAENVKQGSSDEAVSMLCLHEDGSQARGLPMVADRGGSVGSSYRRAMFAMDELYQEMIRSGVCAEQARMVLPQSMYTEWYWTGNLYGFANVYNQRTDSHAQKEVRDVAHQIGEIIEPLFPYSWKALTK